jgi:hypothetical protein
MTNKKQLKMGVGPLSLKKKVENRFEDQNNN